MRPALPLAALVVAAAGFGAGWIARPSPDLPRYPSEAEMTACVLGLGAALDASVRFDKDAALEDAKALGNIEGALEEPVRAAAQALATNLPRRLAEDDPNEAPDDLLASMREACDTNFLTERYVSELAIEDP